MYSWLQQIWYGGRPAPWYLRALSAVFARLMQLRRAGYGHGWLKTRRVAKPVIVVGNITVGGTGKTPLVIWLVQQLGGRGVRAGVVLRGYGVDCGSAEPRWVEAHSDPQRVGDEALLIRLRAGCPVIVGRDRARAAALLAPKVDVVIADDGLQHLRLARDFELAVVDGVRGCGNGRLLPAGPLREPAQRLTSVNQVVITGDGPVVVPDALRMQLRGTMVLPVQHIGALAPAEPSPMIQRTLSSFAGQRVHAIAGIGHPQRFFQALRAAGLKPVEHAFPDHYRYREQDIVFGDELPLLMTEKDAVKCNRFGGANRWYLPVQAQFAVRDATRLLDLLQALVRPPLRPGTNMET